MFHRLFMLLHPHFLKCFEHIIIRVRNNNSTCVKEYDSNFLLVHGEGKLLLWNNRTYILIFTFEDNYTCIIVTFYIRGIQKKGQLINN